LNYFVTGATGFIGRHLLAELLQREGTIYVLVRDGSRGKLDALLQRLGAPEGRVHPVSVTVPNWAKNRRRFASSARRVASDAVSAMCENM